MCEWGGAYLYTWYRVEGKWVLISLVTSTTLNINIRFTRFSAEVKLTSGFLYHHFIILFNFQYAVNNDLLMVFSQIIKQNKITFQARRLRMLFFFPVENYTLLFLSDFISFLFFFSFRSSQIPLYTALNIFSCILQWLRKFWRSCMHVPKAHDCSGMEWFKWGKVNRNML